MRKITIGLLAVSVGFLLLTGCQNEAGTLHGSVVTGSAESGQTASSREEESSQPASSQQASTVSQQAESVQPEPSSQAPAASSAKAAAEPSSQPVAAAAAGESITSEGMTMVLPEGFTVPDSSVLMGYAPDYPSDGSNINLVVGDAGGAKVADLLTSTGEDYAAMMEPYLEQIMGEDLTVEVKDYSGKTVNGMDALRTQYSYQVQGRTVTQVQYLLTENGKLYTYTFTQMDDAKWIDAFEQSAATIQLVQ